jgi:hypothetical protein
MDSGTPGLFVSQGFLVGVAVGIGALVASGLISLRWAKPAPAGGVLLTGGILLGLAVEEGVPVGLAAGVGLLGVAGALWRRWKPAAVGLGGVAVVLLVLATPSQPGSLTSWLALVAAPVALLVADFDDRYGKSAISLPLVAVAFLGMLVTVPDTERAIVAVGVALPMALAGWPLRLARLGAAGSAATAGVFVWLAFAEGVGRPGSVVGAIAALGLLLAEPAVREFRTAGRTRLGALLGTPLGPAAVIGLQGLLALYATRFAGLKSSAIVAALLTVPVLLVVGWWAAWPDASVGARQE